MNDVEPITGKIEPVSLDILNIRYIPVANLERWYPSMNLKDSPHVELLQQYIEHGIYWKILMHGRYAEERRARRIEFKQEKWSEKWIEEHIRIRIEIYESLKRRGYKPEKKDKPVMVLKEPFWKTRFNYKGIEGYEIWNGAGRCAAAYVLGWKTIPAMLVKDTRPGANECDRIMRKYPT